MRLRHSLFLHVPKTGGNWVSHVLLREFPDARRTPKIHTTRKSAADPQAFTFAFVRHPLSWYQSYFSYKQRKGWDPKNDWDQRVKSDCFGDFLETALDLTPGYYSKMLRRYVGQVGDEIDFIGRFETLVDDLITALQMAGEPFNPATLRETPPINQSQYGQHPAIYPVDLIEPVIASEWETVQRFYPVTTAHTD
ncbi:sulfotransferase family 2 domain-containing protein [Stieleria tagensis]|uniref:sulfotransferase family 2 domain-containing protein n=1 Tax=Stieleria tagensis TaxID=2956795 RepID=UPI00209B92D7|nr:sulfotransferase family 2 domain-containing protein [Stieleria tagensis]